MGKKNNRHYVNNKKFTQALTDYYYEKKMKLERGEEPPVLSDYIGECVIKIATKYAGHIKFSRIPYSERDDMISTGIIVALKAIQKSYNPNKGSSGLSFVTAAVYFGYLGVIKFSKNQLDAKNSYIEAFADGQVHMDENTSKYHVYHSDSLNPLREMVDEYKQTEKDRIEYQKNKKERDEERSEKEEKEELILDLM